MSVLSSTYVVRAYCDHCRKRGHTIDDCWSKKTRCDHCGSGHRSIFCPTIQVCSQCGQTGHLAHQCKIRTCPCGVRGHLYTACPKMYCNRCQKTDHFSFDCKLPHVSCIVCTKSVTHDLLNPHARDLCSSCLKLAEIFQTIASDKGYDLDDPFLLKIKYRLGGDSRVHHAHIKLPDTFGKDDFDPSGRLINGYCLRLFPMHEKFTCKIISVKLVQNVRRLAFDDDANCCRHCDCCSHCS